MTGLARCAALACAVVLLQVVWTHAAEPGEAPAARRILGRWEGESICVKKEWNSACNDEKIQYDFVAAKSDGGEVVTLHASKWVNGEFAPMGDLDLVYDAKAREWAAEFSSTRVHIRWSYRLDGNGLVGTCVDLPGRRVARNVKAHRVEAGAAARDGTPGG
jgi:hypothetical protein